MGGPGSGRRFHYGAKHTVERYNALDVRSWQRDGLLQPGGGFRWFSIMVYVEADAVILSYGNAGALGNPSCRVLLDTTPCNYGGVRYWFLCPASGCCRRVAILYLGGRYPACRHCLRLAYRTQNESSADRALTKAQRIRMKLGGSANMTMPFPFKPKGMHWRTYSVLRAKAETATQQAMVGLMQFLERHYPRVDLRGPRGSA